MAPLQRRHDDSDVTNAQLYDAINDLQARVARVESKVGYLFGALAVLSVAVAAVDLVIHITP